jgi:quercetin dioxygenase-like cupin family protein
VAKGDTLCKQNGIIHGCVCLEKGVLIDFFTPMREDFV